MSVNHVELHGICIQAMPPKGYGLAVTSQHDDVDNDTMLMLVPHELLLSLENVWTIAKADKYLHEVLEAMGG